MSASNPIFTAGTKRFALNPELLHHLRAALAVGSIVTLLHGTSLLGWLDVMMLKMVAGPGPAVHRTASTKDDLPVIVLIGPAMYEQAFGQASPLAPERLARLIGNIPLSDGERPRTVVVDLDVSPSPLEVPKDPGRVSLDTSIRRLVASGTVVVLPLPLRVKTAEAQRAKFDWLRDLCAVNGDGVNGQLVLGLADIVTNQGAAMQYQPDVPTLGVVAADPAYGAPICKRVLDPSQRWLEPLLSTAYEGRSALGYDVATGLRPFNARLFSSGETRVVVATSLDRLPEGTPPLAGQALFIGAGYNPQDRVTVPIEGPRRPIDGVVVHAATFDSKRNPVTRVDGLLALAIDIALGVAVGYCFAASWGWHRAMVAWHRDNAAWRALAAPRLSFALNIALAIGLVVTSMLVANAFLYPLNVWVNPGPIVLGIFAKFLLASRHDAGSHAHDARSVRLARMDSVLISLLVLAALTQVLFFHH